MGDYTDVVAISSSRGKVIKKCTTRCCRRRRRKKEEEKVRRRHTTAGGLFLRSGFYHDERKIFSSFSSP